MKRLLYISHRLPYPPDKGERVRAYHALRALAPHFRMTLAVPHAPAPAAEARAILGELCEEMLIGARPGCPRLRAAAALLAGRSASEACFRDAALAEQIRARSTETPFDLVVAYSSSMLQYARHAAPAPCLADLVDVDSAKWSAYARITRRPLRWLYAREARAVAALEARAMDSCRAVAVVSDAEARLLPSGTARAVVSANGVDSEYFDPAAATNPAKSPAQLVFTGQMDYRPNVDGVKWFVRNVWPSLRQRHPQLSFAIVGRSPVAAVRRLARHSGVRVTGAVPDVRPWLKGAAVAVCPLTIAPGVQNKILEAMAMELPVVAAPPAADGLPAPLRQLIRVAESPAQWCDAVCGLLADGAAGLAGQDARRLIVQRHTWTQSLEGFVQLCRELTGEPAAPEPGREVTA